MSTKKRKNEIKKKQRARKKKQINTRTEMSFFNSSHQWVSIKRTFGLCDDGPPSHQPAYLDEDDGSKWIAIVGNNKQLSVRFVALDNSISLIKADGKKDRCCDGLLAYQKTIIFVELTEGTNKNWKDDKDDQLRITINHFEKTNDATRFEIKKAYIANSNRRISKPSYQVKMDRFLKDTGYDLRIQNRIEIE